MVYQAPLYIPCHLWESHTTQPIIQVEIMVSHQATFLEVDFHWILSTCLAKFMEYLAQVAIAVDTLVDQYQFYRRATWHRALLTQLPMMDIHTLYRRNNYLSKLKLYCRVKSKCNAKEKFYEVLVARSSTICSVIYFTTRDELLSSFTKLRS